MLNPPGPYSLGYNNHARSCDCDKCAKCRARDMVNKIATARSEPLSYEPGKTVFVRAHLRRQPNHLNKSPRTYQYLSKELRKLYG